MTHSLDWIRERCAELRAWFDVAPDLSIDGEWGPPLTFDPDQELLYVTAHIIATDGSAANAKERCLEGATKVLEILAHGHKAWIRTAPEVGRLTDFTTDTTVARGYVRFSVHRDEGEWVWPEKPGTVAQMRYVGLAALRSVR